MAGIQRRKVWMLGGKVFSRCFSWMLLWMLLAGTALTPVQASALEAPPVKAAEPAEADSAGWTAFNDCSGSSSYSGKTITSFTVTSGSTTGKLKNVATNTETNVTATFTKTGSPTVQETNGSLPTAGDANTIFNQNVNFVGVINYASSGAWSVTLELSGLDPVKRYTFVTSANRNGSGASYDNRITVFTLSGADGSVNASSTGVTVIDSTSVSFSTGNNTTKGYVAKWTGINPGPDGIIQVKFEPKSGTTEAYGPSGFMLQEEPSSAPEIVVSETAKTFAGEPGTPSATQSYKVSGSGLSAPIALNATGDFEISTSAGGSFLKTLSLPLTSGSVAETTIYVRMNSAGTGTITGAITHASAGATTQTVNLTGSLLNNWTAYNDVAGTPSGNATGFSITGTTSGVLKDFSTGQNTRAMVTITSANNPSIETGDYGGSETATGTDAYNTFHGFVDVAGVVHYGDSGWYVDVAFSGLNPSRTYTFVSTANRNGTSTADPTYASRITQFVISGVDAATNASTSGVTKKTITNPDDGAAFSTGLNTTAGYVARWVNIDPGDDGQFTVRVKPDGSVNQAYGPSVFLLKQETTGPEYTLSVTNAGAGTVSLNPSGGIYPAGAEVTLTPTATAGNAFSGWSGENVDDLLDQQDGTWKIYMDANKSVTANFVTANVMTFRDGLNGYTGAADTTLKENEPGVSFGSATTIGWDTQSDNNKPDYALVQFADLMGSGANQIPTGSQIAAAQLSYTVDSATNGTGDNGLLYEVLTSWDEATTFNSFGAAAGVNAEDYAAASTATAPGGTTSGTKTVDVTASVKKWISGQAANHGWIFYPQGTDGVDVYSSEYATDAALRPTLTVTYLPSAGNAPDAPALVTPADDATDVALSPVLEVKATDTDTTTLSVDFWGREKSTTTPPPGADFSIVVIPDTQNYSTSYPATFTTQTNWIVNNKTTRNIAFVAHVGDTVNTYTSETEYVRADTSMDVLDAGGVVYGMVPGNHDGTPDPGALYTQYFGQARFNGKSYWGGAYSGNTNNNYMLFSASGIDFVVINLQYRPSASILTWAKGILQQYPNRKGIVVSHDILTIGGAWNYQTIYDTLKTEANLFLLLCGHNHAPSDGSAMRQDTYDGHTVTTILSDYQEYPEGGSGYLRILKFSPAAGTITVETYSPTKNSSLSDAEIPVIAYDASGAVPTSFAKLGTVSGVTSGEHAAYLWSDLKASTEYEWYAIVSDGARTTTGPTWSFTTTAGVTCNPLTLDRNDPAGGTLPVPDKVKSTGCNDGYYKPGEIIQFTATPNTGYSIESWSGATGSGASASYTMGSTAATVKVNYKHECYTLTVNVTGTGMSPIIDFEGTSSCPANSYHYQDALNFTAVPDEGWATTSWTGVTVDPEDINKAHLSMPAQAATVSVTYSKQCNALTLARTPTAGGSAPTATPLKSSACAANGQYTIGEVITLTAYPATGWALSSWTGATVSAQSQFTMPATSLTVTANYAKVCYPLTVEGSPEGGGDAPSFSPANSTGCAANQYTVGESITFTARPATGWQLSQWEGTNAAQSNLLTMPAAARTVRALYTQQCYTLTRLANDVNGGALPTVTAQTPASACTGGKYAYNQKLTLLAAPTADWEVKSWSANITQWSGNQAEFTMPAQDATVQVNYGKQCHTLSLSRTPEAGGSLPTATPANSTGCANLTYVTGEAITLSAAPANGYLVDSWTGATAGANNTATLTMTSTGASAQVKYAPTQYTITGDVNLAEVTLSASGAGVTPATTNADGEYTLTVPYGWNGTVTPARVGYTFNPVNRTYANVKANQTAQDYQATANLYTLTLQADHGVITANPVKTQYTYDEAVTLTVTANEGYAFTGWSGDATGVTPSVTVRMTANKTVAANFEPICYPLTLTNSPVEGGAATASPMKSDACGTNGQYTIGEVITLSTIPSIGWELSSWTGIAVSAQSQFTMPAAALTVTANYTKVCYALMTEGSPVNGGDAPSASPANSTGCAANHYTMGEPIQFTPKPAKGWLLSHWDGTNGAQSNLLTMPAADRTVRAVYIQQCYPLTRLANPTSGGQAPTALPAKSAACLSVGSYTYNESITLQAAPNTGWELGSWTGTDGAQLATFKMPDAAHTVTANYTQTCYPLTLSASPANAATAPTANPSQSSGCAVGNYTYQTSITLTGGTPAAGWAFKEWSGTEAKNSATVVMPAAAHAAQAIYALIDYTLTTPVTGVGQVTRAPDQAVYHYGDQVILTALPGPGYSFAGWTGTLPAGATTLTNPITVTIEANTTIGATFTQDHYTLTIQTPTHGSIAVAPAKEFYVYDEEVTVTATPETNYHLVGWTGALSGATNPTTLKLRGNATIGAAFGKYEYSLLATANGNGSVTRQPDNTVYYQGDSVLLTATAAPGWTFTGWSGDLTGHLNPASIVMTSNQVIQANFTQDEYTLTLTAIGSGEITADPENATYHYGDVVHLIAKPATGWSFANWDGQASGTNAAVDVTIGGNTTVSATFTQDVYAVNVTVVGAGAVEKTPAQGPYHYGDEITLNATPDAGWTFAGWTGDATSADAELDITITGNTSLTATFTQDEYELIVNQVGEGGWTVTPEQATYHYGDMVTLTATPEIGWAFAGWSGAATSTDLEIDVEILGDTTLTATFELAEYQLDIQKSGKGQVTATPDSATYHYGDVVTLKATPETGWIFADWSGDVEAMEAQIEVIIQSDLTVIATFDPLEYNLTLSKAGNGTISADPAQDSYHYGDAVVLKATAEPGWKFVGWSGDVEATEAEIEVVITGDTAITATFEQIEYQLTLLKVGSGTVKAAPEKTTYHYGDEVILTATPDTNWQFSEWSGDLSSVANPVTIIIQTDMTITATFIGGAPPSHSIWLPILMK